MTTVDSAPRFSAAEAEEVALRNFGFAAAASPLPSERDQNFLLTAASGERLVLKIANPRISRCKTRPCSISPLGEGRAQDREYMRI
jgi:Ser/Thr protein kinase RdoA (MazF antagonist)